MYSFTDVIRYLDKNEVSSVGTKVRDPENFIAIISGGDTSIWDSRVYGEVW